MKRRTYVVTAATALTLGGCMGSGEDDSGNETDDDSGTDDDGPTTGDDDETTDDEESTESGAETFDDFEDLDPWSAVAGSLSADEDDYYDGSQSALLESDEGGGQVRIVRELSEPTDFSDRHPGLAMATPDGGDVLIQLYDGDGDRIDFRQSVGGDLPFARGNFGIAGVEGEPDLSEVTEIQIAFWVGDEGTGALRVDDLHLVPRPNAGRVLITLDGGYETHYTVAQSLLEGYDYPATAFVPTNRLPDTEEHDGDRMTQEQLEELADAGWTVSSQAAHGDNLTTLDERSQEDEIAIAAEWLSDNGYDAGYFSYPSGAYDAETIELVEEYHDLAFAGRYPAQGYVANPTLTSRVVDPSATEAREMLELTAEYGGITAFAYYRLEEGSRENFEGMLEALAELEGEGELEVVTPSEIENSYLV